MAVKKTTPTQQTPRKVDDLAFGNLDDYLANDFNHQLYTFLVSHPINPFRYFDPLDYFRALYGGLEFARSNPCKPLVVEKKLKEIDPGNDGYFLSVGLTMYFEKFEAAEHGVSSILMRQIKLLKEQVEKDIQEERLAVEMSKFAKSKSEAVDLLKTLPDIHILKAHFMKRRTDELFICRSGTAEARTRAKHELDWIEDKLAEIGVMQEAAENRIQLESNEEKEVLDDTEQLNRRVIVLLIEELIPKFSDLIPAQKAEFLALLSGMSKKGFENILGDHQYASNFDKTKEAAAYWTRKLK